MERTKLLMSSTHSQISSASDRLENRSRLHPMYRSSGPISYGFASLETSQALDTETVCSVGNSSDSGNLKKKNQTYPPKIVTINVDILFIDSGPPSLQNEFDNIQTVERSAETDSLQHTNQATSPQSDISPVIPPVQSGKLHI